ncbi:MAG: SIS domain-containing protein [Anaerolineae bacterium]
MTKRGTHTLREIRGQAKAWSQALHAAQSALPRIRESWSRQDVAEVLFCGCGSTHYLSLTAAAACQAETGIRARGLPSSEVFLFPGIALPPGRSWLVAISRSGETTETVRAAKAFAERKGQDSVLVITCYGNSTLAALTKTPLVASAAQEQSYAQTASFSSMFVLALYLVRELAGRLAMVQALHTLPERGEQIVSERIEEAMRQLGEDDRYQRFFFLGSGPNYGLACEGMLKMKEMSLSYSEAYHFLEFRHGPRSMVDDHSLVIGLLSDRAAQEEVAVLSETQRLGAHVLVVGESPSQLGMLRPEYAVWVESGLSETLRGPLYLPPIQYLAYYRAMHKGLNPDRPTNVEAVIYL